MKNSGFTLIEILVVVAVLGVLGIVITISLTQTLQNTNEERCEDFVSEIEEAACVYASLTNKSVECNRPSCTLSVQTLIEEGLITSETDACTGGEISTSKTVTVSWDSAGEKTCTYNGVKEYGK